MYCSSYIWFVLSFLHTHTLCNIFRLLCLNPIENLFSMACLVYSYGAFVSRALVLVRWLVVYDLAQGGIR